MDVAKLLARWREQPPEQWLGTANRYLPPSVTAVLVIAIAYQLADLTWALVPAAGSGATIVVPAASNSPSKPSDQGLGDYAALSSAHLFGEAAKESTAAAVQPAVVDAPDTTLSLTLTGILAIGGEGKGLVSISSNHGEDRTYQVGQEIENANGSTLNSVFEDRVLLNRGDRLETLRLPKQPSTGAAGSASRAGSSFMPPVAAAPAQNDSLRQVISQNASKLTDVLRLAPAIEGGQVVGFRVNPGRDKDTFEALGLKAGDVVTDINGTQLDDPGKGLQVFESLGEATMANVTVVRDGSPQVIVIDTSQLQNL
ncbi:MAG TPA: type II secretion system protein GspC, partial [Gammaproteobacteria bacterium]|nr:type II secretion system protein GspC [Gammaproteobacteria bacterium]